MPRPITASGSDSSPNGIATSASRPNGMMTSETSGAASRLPMSE